MAAEARTALDELRDKAVSTVEVLVMLGDQVVEVAERAQGRGETETAQELLAVVAEATQHLRKVKA